MKSARAQVLCSYGVPIKPEFLGVDASLGPFTAMVLYSGWIEPETVRL